MEADDEDIYAPNGDVGQNGNLQTGNKLIKDEDEEEGEEVEEDESDSVGGTAI